MKIRPLLLIVAALAVVAVVVHFVTRPAGPPPADARVGQPLVDAALIERASTLTLREGDRVVDVTKAPDGTWRVASYYDLPVDFAKLSRFVGDLRGAKQERLVTRNPESIARLEFKDTRIALAAADGTELWSVTLGKNADGGGRFVRFGNEDAAFLTRFSAWLDLESRNWADTQLVGLKSEDVARVEISYPDAPTLTVSRPSAAEPFAVADGAATGRTLRLGTLTSLVSTLSSLRFTDTTTPDDADAVEARQHARTFVLTTFAGETVTVSLGRRPEAKRIKPPEAAVDPATLLSGATTAGPDMEILTPETETVPAGPVFAFVTHSKAEAPVNALMARRAAKVAEFSFTGLPATVDTLFEPAAEDGSTAAPAP